MSSSESPIYDFIIVGGGTSGAVVAGNLARSRQRPRVLVIELGGDNKRPELRVAAERFTNIYINDEIRIPYKTTPQKHVKGRTFDYLRGKGLGGSSIANYEAYIRGAASDYDEWAERVGDDFFAWKNTVHRYNELENLHFVDDKDEDQTVKLKKGVHGFDGPLDISISSRKEWPVGMDKLLEASIRFGWPICQDQNSGDPIGIGSVSTTSYKGYRTTSGSAYLYDPLPNLDIWCHVKATRILFECRSNNKPKAIGLQLSDGREVRARNEIILSAGAIDSPKLLFLSGIGPRQHLESLSIECLVDLPDIGRKMFDHCFVQLTWRVSHELSDIVWFDSNSALRKTSREEWLRSRTGLDAQRNLSNFIGFLKFHPDRADLSELENLPEGLRNWISKPDVPQIEIFLRGVYPEDWHLQYKEEFLGINIMLMNPQSQGTVSLASKDPTVDPVIDPNYLAHPYDRRTLIDGVRETLAFVRSPYLSQFIEGDVLVPESDRDEDILSFCQSNLGTVLHACGTARMGNKSDTTASLDTDFRVRGVDNLRVIDLSATPLMTNNHTMATAFVVGQMGWTKLAEEYGLSLPPRTSSRI